MQVEIPVTHMLAAAKEKLGESDSSELVQLNMKWKLLIETVSTRTMHLGSFVFFVWFSSFEAYKSSE